MPAADRSVPELLSRILSKSSGPDERGCWPWTACRSDGYGQMSMKNRQVRAHRVAYQLFVGPIADGLHLDHLCRNKSCINPAHLEPVTAKENYRRAFPYIVRQTHCIRGHEQSGDNVRVYNGKLACGACIRIRQRMRPRWRSNGFSRTVLIAFISRVARLECFGGHTENARFLCVSCRARTLVARTDRMEGGAA